MIIVLKPLLHLWREAVSGVMATLHAAKMVTDGEQVVVVVLVQFTLAGGRVLPEIHVLQKQF